MPPKLIPPALSTTTQQFAEVFITVTKTIEDIVSSNPESKEPIQKLLSLSSPTRPLLNFMVSRPGKPPPSKTTESAPSAPTTGAKGKTLTPTFASAATSPPHPSILVSLSNLNWNKGRPSPANLHSGINRALEASGNDQVHISATKWTARENMILTGGPNTSAHHLQQATFTISQYLSETYPSLLPQSNQIIPTGDSTDSRARTPYKCHAMLVLDNPSYASLNITQKPSWVCDLNSYTEGAVSSLVVAFEDPDGSLKTLTLPAVKGQKPPRVQRTMMAGRKLEGEKEEKDQQEHHTDGALYTQSDQPPATSTMHHIKSNAWHCTKLAFQARGACLY
ncbi:hypothetical protein EI94DRAFT_1700528 [Lactarius quietus]|nr:hypothetical protein EI94DRAFT_1700528 [Lactarius quietus]